MTDPMDDRLRAAAERWRADQPTPARLDVDRLDGPRRRVPWGLVVPAAAAAVVAIVLVTSTLAHRDGGPTSSEPAGPSSTAATPDVVPWAPLAATHPLVRTSTPNPSTDGVRQCATSDLTAHDVDGFQGAAGTGYDEVVVRLRGTDPCVVDGDPHVVVHSADGQVLDSRQGMNAGALTGPRGPVLVTPSTQAMMIVSWPDSCFSPDTGARIDVALADGDQPIELPGHGISTVCDPGFQVPSVPATMLGVYAFAPLHPLPATVTTPYDGIAVTGDLDVSGAPGGTVDFAVTLETSTDTPLSTCPDYSINVGAHAPQRWSLNCLAVPFTDAQGRPYLPADTPVTFAMQLTVPLDLTGRQKLLWTIDGPESAPGANGVITIEP